MTHHLARLTVAGLLLLSLGAAVSAQPVSPAAMTFAPPQNVIQLSATGQVEVLQDMLTLTLSTTHEGGDASAVQAALRKALDTALAQVKTTAQPGQMDVRTGDFSISPRYSRDGKVNGWHGRAALILEGRDFPRITQAAARATSMTIGDVSFDLSREQRAKVEAEAQTIAIDRFRARAVEVAKAFGFGGYTLREVSVSGNDGDAVPRMYSVASKAQAMLADAPVPVEPGRSTVQVTVSGTVQAQ